VEFFISLRITVGFMAGKALWDICPKTKSREKKERKIITLAIRALGCQFHMKITWEDKSVQFVLFLYLFNIININKSEHQWR
jgi:hypothetical protein